MATTKTSKTVEKTINITPPNMGYAEIYIRGLEPLLVARFSKKAELMEKMAEGASAKNKKERKARDYNQEAMDAKHISTEGWDGISASAFRAASISACRLVNFKMTMAKMSIFIVADGYDRDEGSPLVRIYHPDNAEAQSIGHYLGNGAVTNTMHVRNATGVVDIRSRPLYRSWGCRLKLRYDHDQFKPEDVFNLISRAGLQVGVCEGRPDSKSSAGLGYGIFEIVPEAEVQAFRAEYGIE